MPQKQSSTTWFFATPAWFHIRNHISLSMVVGPSTARCESAYLSKYASRSALATPLSLQCDRPLATCRPISTRFSCRAV